MTRIVYAIVSATDDTKYLTFVNGRAQFDTAPFAYAYDTKTEAAFVASHQPERSRVVPVIVEAGTIKLATTHDFYREAIEADDQFSHAVQAIFGYSKNRWTADVHAHPTTKAAFMRKVQTFNDYIAATKDGTPAGEEGR